MTTGLLRSSVKLPGDYSLSSRKTMTSAFYKFFTPHGFREFMLDASNIPSTTCNELGRDFLSQEEARMNIGTATAGRALMNVKIWSAGLALLALAWPARVCAELGGSVDSVQADQEQMKGTRRITNAANYSIHEIQAESGTKVREFVSPAGTVFAVAWDGPFKPDMRQLLGNYFDQYVQTIQSKRPRRGAVSIQRPDLVVESSGHMRSFTGRAYLPQMTPQNVNPAAIK